MYFVYILKSAKDQLYIGVTKNIEKRLYCHATNRGAEFTKYKNKFKCVFVERYGTLVEARKREIQIKKWRRDKKQLLIEKYSLGLETKLKKSLLILTESTIK